MNVGKVASAEFVQTELKVQARALEEKKAEKKPKPEVKKPDIKQTKSILNEFIKNTRFRYSINEKIDSFVVKIIDKDTDKVVKEIPSRELQKLHENLREAIGIFIDQMV